MMVPGSIAKGTFAEETETAAPSTSFPKNDRKAPAKGLKAPANPFAVPRTQPREVSQLPQSLSSLKTCVNESERRNMNLGDVWEALAGHTDELRENSARRSPPECSFYSRDATYSQNHQSVRDVSFVGLIS
jgi:hypothetical protein